MSYRPNKGIIIGIAVLALAASYCTLPLFVHQSLPYAQDIAFHIFQSDQFNQGLHEGPLYPRWVSDSNNGYGSPNFVFYAPLSYYAAAFIKLFFPSMIVSMIIAIWCGFFLSGVTMFVAARKLFGDSGSLLAAMLYQILPFHMMDLYLRGTFAELLAFVWFPLILLYVYEALYSEGYRMAGVVLALSYAGLVLTHLVSGFIFSVVIGSFLIFHFFSKGGKRLIKTLLSLALGFGLAAFYLIPAIFERRFVQIEYLINCPVGDYRKNFLFAGDKFQVKFGDYFLSLYIGVILEVLFFLLIAWMIWRSRQRATEKSQVNFFIFVFLFALFLTTPLSKPLWEFLPGFSILQFPWRWLSVMEVSLCFLLGAVYSFDKESNVSAKNFKTPIIYLFVIFLLMSFLMISRSKILPGQFLKKISNIGQIKHDIDPPIEYTPIWIGNIEKIYESENEKISVISGSAAIQVTEWKSEKRIFNIEAFSPSILRVSTFYYPGWEARLDGNKTRIGRERESGAMLMDIPEGKHNLVFKFMDTQLRYYSKLISLLSFIIMVLFMTFSNSKKKKL